MKRRDFLKGAAIGAGVLASGMLPGRAKADDWGKRKKGVNFYRIDSYAHFAPMDYITLLEQLNLPIPPPNSQRPIIEPILAMHDVTDRLKMMDDCGIDVSIRILPNPLSKLPQMYSITP